MDLYLIRHAESANNAMSVESRQDDPPLTPRGRKQAACLAETVRTLGLTRLETSPFLRTLETARPIAEATRLAPHVRVDLHEYGGCFLGWNATNIRPTGGMGRSAIAGELPGSVIPEDLPEEGWWSGRSFEHAEETAERAARVARDLTANGAGGERIGLVTHGTFAQFLIAELVGLPFLRRPWVGGVWNASLTRFRISPEGVKLETFNDVSHLPDSIATGPGNPIEGY